RQRPCRAPAEREQAPIARPGPSTAANLILIQSVFVLNCNHSKIAGRILSFTNSRSYIVVDCKVSHRFTWRRLVRFAASARLFLGGRGAAMRCVLTSPPFPAELALPAGARRTAQLCSTGRRLAVLMTATALSAGLVQAQEVVNARDKSNAASPADM